MNEQKIIYKAEDGKEFRHNCERWEYDFEQSRRGLKRLKSIEHWSWLLGKDWSNEISIRHTLNFEVDHERACLDKNGRRMLINMPYDFRTRDLIALAAFCEAHNLDVEITSELPWVQGSTVTIFIKESLANFEKRKSRRKQRKQTGCSVARESA